jgi:hypothetical protein
LISAAWIAGRARNDNAHSSQFTIQSTPNLSVSMPNWAPQKVFWKGISIRPPRASASNTFLPRAASLGMLIETEKPL